MGMKNNKHNNTESQKGNYEKSLDNAINYLDDYLVSHEPDSDHYNEVSQLHLWLFELRELRSDVGKFKSFDEFLKLIDRSSVEESREIKRLKHQREEITKYAKSMNKRYGKIEKD